MRCLEPTYEGLKLLLGSAGTYTPYSLEPTYEGLKLERPVGMTNQHSVWSLPMRD